MILCLFGCELRVRAQGSERSSSAQPSPGKKIKFLLKTLKVLKISHPSPEQPGQPRGQIQVCVPEAPLAVVLGPSFLGGHTQVLPAPNPGRK